MTDAGNVVRLDAAQAALRDHFVGWQCRVRQLAARQAGGRPTSGMRPQVTLSDGDHTLGAITVLIVKREPEVSTAEFRHMVRRTHDPAERYDGALKILSATYYQHPKEFSDQLTALFGPGAATADRLLDAEECQLHFEQYSQRYRIPCTVGKLPETHPAFQATYWHNSLFNPAIPPGIRVLAFRPDWGRADADPRVA